MSYAIYKTEALIIRITPNGEANMDVTFFTRDLGKITARVQSARKSESKMRMHLTRYNHVMIDLVRGKSIWRLTGVQSLSPLSIFQDQLFYMHGTESYHLPNILFVEKSHILNFLIFF
jgi:recombinational DNA repair protein (RecF pathway)